MLKDLKTLRFETHTQQSRQPAIVHAATGEGHLANARRLASFNCCVHEGSRYGGVEMRRDAGLRDVGAEIAYKGAP